MWSRLEIVALIRILERYTLKLWELLFTIVQKQTQLEWPSAHERNKKI